MSFRNYLRRMRESLKSQPSPRRRTCKLQFDRLEDRLAPTCNPLVIGPILQADCDNAANTLTLSHAGTTTTLTYTGGSRSFADSTFNRITLNMGGNADTVNVQSTVKNVNVTGGGGQDNVTLNANVGGIAAAVTVSNALGSFTALTVDAATVPFAYTATLSESTITFGVGGFPLNYVPASLRSLTLRGGINNNTYNITNTPSSSFAGGVVTTVQGGAGIDVFFVLSTAIGTTTALNGGDGNDAFVLGEPDISGLAGTVNIDGQTGAGGGGFGRLNDSGVAVGRSYTWTGDTLRWDTAAITHANLGYFYLYTGLADDTVQVQGVASVYRGVLDSGGADTLLGPDAPTTWALTDLDTGSFLDFQFSGIDNLVGGSDDDDFVFADGAGISGYLIGGDGQNRLSYDTYTTNVFVSLPLYTATGVGWFIYQIRHANGGAGDDILVGDEHGNRFSGGLGRDLLIGGGINWYTYEYSFIPDVLVGNDGDDILIGGYTWYDFDPASLMAILAEWTRDASYEERMTNLTTGNGVPLLDASTVYSNYAANLMIGGAGQDLFYGLSWYDQHDWDELTETFVPVG